MLYTSVLTGPYVGGDHDTVPGLGLQRDWAGAEMQWPGLLGVGRGEQAAGSVRGIICRGTLKTDRIASSGGLWPLGGSHRAGPGSDCRRLGWCM